MRLKNVKPQRFFSDPNKARHLQLYLPGPDGNTTEHQQLRRSWPEDNRFGKCIEWKCIEQKRDLERPGGARKHSGMIRLGRSNSED